MKATLGYGASTCSYSDWLQANLIVFLGSNVANNQPVTTKYLHYAKQNGAKIAVVNTFREPGLDRYWVPSVVSSAVLGTFLADHWFHVTREATSRSWSACCVRSSSAAAWTTDFVAVRTVGYDAARAAAVASDWDALERESGESRERMQTFAQLLVEHPKTIFVWSMGLTQHAHGVETIKALVNVGLARGLPGREGFGLVPIRGHSGVQGGAEVGCVPKVDAATAARWADVWGFPIPSTPGWTRRRWLNTRRLETSTSSGWSAAISSRRCPTSTAPRRALERPSSPRPPGHRRLIVDACRQRRRCRPAPGCDALRVAGWRHRDVDRAADYLFAGNPGAADWIGTRRVAGVRRGHGAHAPQGTPGRFGSTTSGRSATRSRARSRSIAVSRR
jgi:hypothetical protein